MRVCTVNNNSRTINCKCSLFSKKNPIIWIFCISGWLVVPINQNKWSSAVLETRKRGKVNLDFSTCISKLRENLSGLKLWRFMTPSGLNRCHCFGEIYCLHRQVIIQQWIQRCSPPKRNSSLLYCRMAQPTCPEHENVTWLIMVNTFLVLYPEGARNSLFATIYEYNSAVSLPMQTNA
jgi:hypothetical protein